MNERELFTEALRLPTPAERAGFLDQACAGNPALRDRVESLLQEHDNLGSFLEAPLPHSLNATSQFTPSEGPASMVGTEAHDPDRITRTFDDRTLANVPSGRTSVETGTVIAGRYTLLQVIGEGGMGSVYLASQSEPVQRQVALKLIKAGMDSKSVLARFDAERQALAVMDHPNIARIYDGGVTPTGQPFFVMELVNGVPLTTYSDQHRLTVDARLQLFVAVCQAVQHAHQKGIIHRDLKPGNVLVTEVDGRPTPKVIDFGVAKATEQKLTDMSFSDVGAIVGTPAYMSPEQADPSSMDIDTRTDVYALGVILYELLTGSPPIESKDFKRGAIIEMLRMVREVEPPRPSTKLSTADALPNIAASRNIEPAKLSKLLQGELDWVVMKAIEKDRTRRYDTANGLARDIQRYLTDEVVEARPPSRGYRLKKYVKRNKVQVIAVSLVLLALIGGVIGTSIGMVRAENSRQAEEAQRRVAYIARDGEKTERQKAQGLAEDNAKLAVEEREAKNQATKLAQANAQLATKEQEARLETEKLLLRTKAILFTSQMDRVAQIQEKDPNMALDLLHDAEACPIDLRDMAWKFVEHACKRRMLASFPIPGVTLQAISPDGKLLATAPRKLNPFDKLSTVTLIEIPSGKIRATLASFTDSVGLLAFSPDSSKLAVVADGNLFTQVRTPEGKFETGPPVPGKVQLWDVAELKRVATFEGHTDRLTSLAFSPDGTLLATGSLDKTARVWDVKTAKEKQIFKEHAQEVGAVAFSPDSKRLATGGFDNTIKLWNLEDFKLHATWTASLNPDPALAEARLQFGKFGQSANYLGIGGTRDAVVSLDFSPDGSTLVSANSNWLIEFRDVATGQIRSTLPGQKNAVRWVRFYRDGNSVLIDQPGNTLSLTQWDVKTGQKLISLSGGSRAGVVDFCKQRSLVSMSSDTRCDILDLDASVERARFETEKVKGNAAVTAFSCKGDILAVGCGDRIFLWDVRTGELRKPLIGHKNFVKSLAVSPDGRMLASASSTFRVAGNDPLESFPDDVRLWDINTGESLGTISIGKPAISSVAFSPDGTTLATLHWEGENGQVRKPIVSLWDAKTRQLRFPLEIPNIEFSLFREEFAQLAFNPSDGTLLTSIGRFLGIWNLETRKLNRQILVGAVGPFGGSEFVALAISPDGKAIATGNLVLPSGSEINIWNPNTGELVKKVRNVGIQAMSYTPDGRNLVMQVGGSIQIWDTLTMQQRASFVSHNGTGHIGLTISPDGQTLATVLFPRVGNIANVITEASAEVKLWDVSRSPTLLTFLQGRTGRPSGLRFSPDSKTLIETDSGAGALRFWDLSTGRVRIVVDTTTKKVGAVLSPDGRYLAGSDVAGDRIAVAVRRPDSNLQLITAFLTILDTHTGVYRQIEVGKGPISYLAYSPDGNRLALVHDTSMGDGKVLNRNILVEIWDLAANKAVANFAFPNMSSSGAPLFTPDGNTLAVPGNDRIIMIDLQKSTVLSELSTASNNFITTIKYTKDGNRLVVRHGPPTATPTIWDWRTSKQVDEPIPDIFGNPDVSMDGRYELKRLPHGVEVVDRTVNPPAIVSHRYK